MSLKIEEIVHHRNGVGGEEFNVVKFVCPEGGNMIGIVFDLQLRQDDTPVSEWNGRVAVLNRDLLAEGNIAFGENSWRGDVYETELRAAIKEKMIADEIEWNKKIEEEREAMLLSLDPRESAMNGWDGERPQPVI